MRLNLANGGQIWDVVDKEIDDEHIQKTEQRPAAGRS